MLKNVKTGFVKRSHRHLTKYYPDLGVGSWSLKGIKENTCSHKNLDDLISNHFEKFSSPEHICRATLKSALENLNGREACILETGSSAWGSNSSLLFDSYVSNFGGTFESVDLRIEPSITLHEKCSTQTTLYCDDSIRFLKKWVAHNLDKKIELLYLDSWDVNWANPTPSALHGLAEFLAASPNLKNGSLLLIDDTPINPSFFAEAQPDLINFMDFYKKHGFYPGKGSIVKELLKSIGRGEEIQHQYQLLWKF